MTMRVGDVVILAAEPDRRCELCGAMAECRPYGPNHEQICYRCGRLNPEATELAMQRLFFGIIQEPVPRG